MYILEFFRYFYKDLDYSPESYRLHTFLLVLMDTMVSTRRLITFCLVNVIKVFNLLTIFILFRTYPRHTRFKNF